MKKACIIFSIIGVILTNAISIFYLVEYFYFLGILIFFLIGSLSSIAVFVLEMISLYQKRKIVAIGVLTIIFVSPIAGIFYLNIHYIPTFSYSSYSSLPKATRVNAVVNSDGFTKEQIVDELTKLKTDLSNKKITQDEYEAAALSLASEDQIHRFDVYYDLFVKGMISKGIYIAKIDEIFDISINK